MGVMTSAQLHAARMLIPGEYERKAPPIDHATRGAPGSASPLRDAGHLRVAEGPHVVAAPARPTTRLGFAGAILGDIALCVALIYGALVPGLAIHGIQAAVTFILKTVGGH
jgi:hypothetical protein